MSKKKCVCVNGCEITKVGLPITINEDGSCEFKYPEYNFCPKCGGYMPETLRKVEDFFKVCSIHEDLNKAMELFYKGEFESAARETFIVVETCLRRKSGLDEHGCELVGKALSFNVDKSTQEINKKPLIAINALKTDSERNEQRGLLNMLTGFFMGPRNIFQHNHVAGDFAYMASIILEASTFLYLLDGNTITKPAQVISGKISCREIYGSMKKKSDRLKFVKYMSKRNKKIKIVRL